MEKEMNPWEEIKVGDLGRIVTGKTPKTAEKDNYDGNIMFVTPSDNMDAKYIVSTGKRLTEKGKCSVKGAIIPAGSVCVSCIGSDLGKVVITTEECVTNQQINSIVVNTNKYDIDFVYYSLLVLGKELNFHSKTSTAVPIVNKSSFSSFSIRCPSLETQKRIAGILSSIDNKIITNESINQNLFQQLHAYYLEIFAYSDMNTPLGDVVMTTSGGTPSRKHDEYYSDANICWVKSKELLGGYIQDTEEHINDIAIKSSSAKLLPAYSVLIAMYGATVGAYGIIASPMTCNQAVCALLNNDSYPYTYLFQVACESQARFANLAVGSAQQNISQVLIKQLPIHGDLEAIKKFHSLALPMHEEINTLCAENVRLAKIRDVLLPRLMSGELVVSEIDL